MTAIEIKNVSKKFRVLGKEFYALKDVTLDVKDREILALVGPNGSGKTTLLNIITGLLIPDSGYVKILGKKPDTDVVEKIGFVSSDARFHWALTMKDVLNFYGIVYGMSKASREKRILQLADFFGFEELLGRRFDGLSTGERMRLSFAKALLNNPRILLLDEPTLGLDPDISIKLRKEIKHINKEFGTAILLTSHYMKEVHQLADRIAFILKGEIHDIRSAKGVDLDKYFVRMVKEGV